MSEKVERTDFVVGPRDSPHVSGHILLGENKLRLYINNMARTTFVDLSKQEVDSLASNLAGVSRLMALGKDKQSKGG